MFKHGKKFMAIALCAMLLLGGCATGGDKDSSSKDSGTKDSSVEGEKSIYTEPGTLPIVNEKISLKIFTTSRPNIEDFETNTFTKYLEEKTGIDLVFETVPTDAEKEKINLKLTSGDYPDMFMGVTVDEGKFGVDEGVLYDVTEMIDTKMPNLKGIIDKHETMRGALTATDGKIYMLPDYNDCFHCTGAQKMWVNTAQLEKMGEKVPTTTDEFYNVCKKFLEQNPNGVPLAGYLGWFSDISGFLGNAFTYRGGDTYGLRLKDGTVDSAIVDPEYREYFKFANKLYNDKLLYEASFTMDIPQMKSLLVEEGEPVLFYPAVASVNMIDVGTTSELYSHYYPIAPLKGPKGVQYATYIPTQPALFNTITTACEYPEAAARLMDYNYDPIVKNERDMGPKGEGWDDPDGLGLTGEPALFKRIAPYSQEPQNVNWQDVPISYTPSELRFGQQTPQDVDIFSTEGLEYMLYKATKDLYEPYFPTDFAPLPNVKFLTEENTALQTIKVEIEKYIKEMNVQFTTGVKDPNKDADWDAYVKGLKDIGIDKLITTYQTAYDRQYK